MPSSCRPYGSGLPIARRKIASHAATSAGRSRASNMMALLVPPRMNDAGIRCGAEVALSVDGRDVVIEALAREPYSLAASRRHA